MRADALKPGERLQRKDRSIARVMSVTSRGPPEPVYNLEVNAEHVYRVGHDGLLVHNTGLDCSVFAREMFNEHGGSIYRLQKYNGRNFTLPEYKVDGYQQPPFDHHYCQMADQIVRDPAYPGGISLDRYFNNVGAVNFTKRQNFLNTFEAFLED